MAKTEKNSKPNQASSSLPGGKKEKDGKKKKSLDNFTYGLAWIGFASILGSAFVKLVKSMEAPKKDDYYK
jgi:hypothetical protein